MIFINLANVLAARNAHLLVVNFPENPKYKTTDKIGYLGPYRTAFDQLATWLKNLESQNPYFHFYDANMDGDHDYTDAEARDRMHLNNLGAKKISTRIDSLMSIYLNKN